MKLFLKRTTRIVPDGVTDAPFAVKRVPDDALRASGKPGRSKVLKGRFRGNQGRRRRGGRIRGGPDDASRRAGEPCGNRTGKFVEK